MPTSFWSNVVALASLFLVPYYTYEAYLWYELRSPYGSRPLNSDRALLVVSSQASGTRTVAAALNACGLEVGHEASDATRHFVRDGTISSLHALLMLENVDVRELCENGKLFHVFHPSTFEHSKCDPRFATTKCEIKQCFETLERFVGCALRDDCPARFHKKILLVRHPLRLLESLVVKYCTSMDAPEVRKPFVHWVNAVGTPKAESCSERLLNYVEHLWDSIGPVVDVIVRIEDGIDDIHKGCALGEKTTRITSRDSGKLTLTSLSFRAPRRIDELERRYGYA